ncbi:hypothetical protein ACHQM5_025383 [Ranunculus cassubicifolius]
MEKTRSPVEEVEPLDSIRNNDDDGDSWYDDGSYNDREWEKLRDNFHTIGYRDGLTAGKEAAAQEGFNIGFKQSVLVGYKWGYVRGFTGAIMCLPNGLKEKLVATLETREKLQNLYVCVQSVSTQNALKEFHADIIASESKEQNDEGSLVEMTSSSILGRYIGEFESLKLGSSVCKKHIGGEESKAAS